MPALASSLIQLVHNTTIASLVTLPDLLGQALDIQSMSDNPSPLLVVVAVYWTLLLPLTWIARRPERRLATSDSWIGSRTSFSNRDALGASATCSGSASCRQPTWW